MRVERMSGDQRVAVLSGTALRWRDIADAAVTVLDVVPMDESATPGAGLVQAGKTLGRVLRSILGRANH